MRDHDRPVGSGVTPRVAVVDDGSQTRDTFQIAYPELRLEGAFATVDSLIASRPVVDLVILDLMLSTGLHERAVLQGPPAIRALGDLGYRVCLYTDERRPLVLAHCLAAGAIGLVRKSDSLATNQQAFVRAADGQVVIARSLVGLAEILNRRGRLPTLTERQLQVLTARARGEPWDSIARRLSISAKTAADRLEAVMSKMVWFLHDVGLDPDASPADIERVLGLAPGDLMDPRTAR
ncbi:MAG: response regulator transcription factor [Micropruina sp.]|nr:response regulator transcription factor [Micropruina sp.]